MDSLPLWYWTLLLYFVSSTAYSLMQRNLALKNKIPLSLLPALFFAVIVYPIALLISPFVGDYHINWQPEVVALLLFSGVSIGIFNVLPFHINKHLDATQYIIINNFYTPLTVLLGVFALNEAFSGKQFIGMLLLVFGAILVAIKGFRRETFKFDKWALYCAGASVLLGTGLAAERASLNYMSASSYMVIGWGIQTITTLLMARKDWHAIRKLSGSDWLDVIRVGFTRTGHVVGFLMSVAISKNVALIASASSFRIPLVFIASFFILRERDHLPRKVIGVVIATLGLILL